MQHALRRVKGQTILRASPHNVGKLSKEDSVSSQAKTPSNMILKQEGGLKIRSGRNTSHPHNYKIVPKGGIKRHNCGARVKEQWKWSNPHLLQHFVHTDRQKQMRGAFFRCRTDVSDCPNSAHCRLIDDHETSRRVGDQCPGIFDFLFPHM